MTSLSKQFDVKKLDDIIALIALYRPGPMELIPEYVKAKKGITPIKYLHPLLEDICADTYGVMIYQEQVMAAASKLAGYSLAQADLLRRAMGKKDKEKMAKERREFHRGLRAHEQDPGEKSQCHFRFAGKIRRLRIQQKPQRSLRRDQLSNGVSQGALPGGIHGGFAEQRNQQHGKNFRFCWRMQTDGHFHPAAGYQQERFEIHARKL